MRDNICILIKRAKNYIDDNGDIIKGIGDLILEYGEFLYLEDLAILIIGDGKYYDTVADARAHTSRAYWESSIKFNESLNKYLGGSVVKELYVDHEYFAKVTNTKLFNDATVEKNISITDNSYTIANTKFVQTVVTNNIKDSVNELVSSITGVPGKSNTITELVQSKGKVYAKFEPIELSYDQLKDGEITKVPKPSEFSYRPNPSSVTGAAGVSSRYAREDHSHRMNNAGNSTKPVYIKDGQPVACGDTIDAHITGTAAVANKLNTSSAVVGSANKPIYFSNGAPVECGTTLNVSVTGNAATATKIGSGTVGSTTKPIYINNGTPTQCNDTIAVNITGNATTANSATTATKIGSGTIGSATKPVYINNGTPTSCGDTLAVNITGNAATANKVGTSTVGSGTRPIYLNGGVATSCGDTLGVNITGNAATATKVGTSTVGSASIPVYINNGVPTKCTSISLDTTGTANKVKSSSNNNFYVAGVKAANGDLYYNTSVSVSTNNVLMGGAWNDIAEYRDGRGKPGDCVCEDGNGRLVKSSKHLQKCPCIVSDTFGFAIGETETCKLPIAISGRVLVNSRESLKVGDVVCAGKYGCVEKMSRLETILFPDRIVGIVSEIPTYDIWNNSVDVNNRIWIKVV